MAEEAARRGAVPSIPNRDWEPDRVIPRRIQNQIADSDYIIAIASQGGGHIAYLNKEIAYSQSLTPRKPLLLITDPTIQVNPSYERIIINRGNPLSTISEVSQRIQRLIHERNTQNLLTGILVGGLTLLLLYSLKED